MIRPSACEYAEEQPDPRSVQRPESVPTDYRGSVLQFWDETITTEQTNITTNAN